MADRSASSHFWEPIARWMRTFWRRARVADLLTAASVLVAAITLWYSWAKDREIRVRDQADRVRGAAAKTLAKLQRWKDLSLSLCPDADSVFIDTSAKLFDGSRPSEVKDFSWKNLESLRTQLAERIRAEEIEMAYVDLDAYQPYIYRRLEEAVQSLKNEEAKNFSDLQQQVDVAVLSFSKTKFSDTGAVGDQLRDACTDWYQDAFRKKIDAQLDPILKLLADLISAPDEQVLGPRQEPAEKPGAPPAPQTP